MDRRQIAMRLAFQALDEKFSVKSFADRLRLQKTIYLLQSAGVNLGYHYSWYLRGPYSRGLTADAFSIEENESIGQEWALDEKSKENIRRVKPLMTLPSGFGKTREQWLELAASIQFLIDTNQTNATSQNLAGHIVEVLAKNGKDFTPDEVSIALRQLEKTGHR